MLHAILWAAGCAAAGFAARAVTTRFLHWVFGRLARDGPGRSWRLAVGQWVLTVGLNREEKQHAGHNTVQ